MNTSVETRFQILFVDIFMTHIAQKTLRKFRLMCGGDIRRHFKNELLEWAQVLYDIEQKAMEHSYQHGK